MISTSWTKKKKTFEWVQIATFGKATVIRSSQSFLTRKLLDVSLAAVKLQFSKSCNSTDPLGQQLLLFEGWGYFSCCLLYCSLEGERAIHIRPWESYLTRLSAIFSLQTTCDASLWARVHPLSTNDGRRTFKDTPLPNVTSPDTVKWSSSNKSGMVSKRFKKSFTCWLIQRNEMITLNKTSRRFAFGFDFPSKSFLRFLVVRNLKQ